MNVFELQKYLSDFNPNAEVKIVVNNRPTPFELLYGGGGEGGTKQTADHITFYVDSTSDVPQATTRNHPRTSLRERSEKG